MPTDESKIIAVCGVDGAGKTSIVNYLESNSVIEDAVYLRRKKYRDSNLNCVSKYVLRSYDDHRDWMGGTFAKCIGLGIALDFLRFYDENAEVIRSGKYVLFDRYTPCYLSYLESVGGFPGVRELFESVARPRLVLYVDAGLGNLDSRYSRRCSGDDDENVEVMKQFHEAYMEFLRAQNISYVCIDNSGEFENTIDQVVSALKEVGVC